MSEKSLSQSKYFVSRVIDLGAEEANIVRVFPFTIS